jgi:hypothetical protein
MIWTPASCHINQRHTNRQESAYPRLEEFLLTIGRRKFIKPLYEELAKTPEGRERALAIYRRARSTYHPISVASIDDVRFAPVGAKRFIWWR